MIEGEAEETGGGSESPPAPILSGLLNVEVAWNGATMDEDDAGQGAWGWRGGWRIYIEWHRCSVWGGIGDVMTDLHLIQIRDGVDHLAQMKRYFSSHESLLRNVFLWLRLGGARAPAMED